MGRGTSQAGRLKSSVRERERERERKLESFSNREIQGREHLRKEEC